ncbi:hypothetical protein CAEBREN_22672 [Caenorhabditis brenneri]|uniref:Uncharacterized protein n=1 Tax=Caenorhabditis brenneri TaxID=135651 RepID=G0N170_CAEBE|nr:hypothetical protein CAEBREN_22672 [Caenorhabditis brenneri]
MLNETCRIEDPLVLSIIHNVLFILSTFIYAIAFFLLIRRCPSSFREFRNYLVAHVFSGLLLDYHIRIIWNVSAITPFVALCSKGFFAEFTVISSQIFIFLLGFLGFTAISLFIFRMKAVNQHVDRTSKIRKWVPVFKFIFYSLFLLTLAFSIFIYPEWRWQTEYKRKIEQKFGSLPPFVWCDNCYFIRFDTWTSILFFILAYFAIFSAFITGALAAIETLRVLNSKNLKLSAKTAMAQRKLTYNLVAVTSVHIALLFIPSGAFLVASFAAPDYQFMSDAMLVLIEDHGSLTTLTMLLTNNLLRRSAIELFRIPMFCPQKTKITQGTGTSVVVNVVKMS